MLIEECESSLQNQCKRVETELPQNTDNFTAKHSFKSIKIYKYFVYNETRKIIYSKLKNENVFCRFEA